MKRLLLVLALEALVLLGGLLFLHSLIQRKVTAEEQVVLGVSPRVCHAPCVVAVTIRVPAAGPHDYARVELDGPEYHSTAVNVVEGRSTYVLPPWLVHASGEYTATAVLLRGENTFIARLTIQVGGTE